VGVIPRSSISAIAVQALRGRFFTKKKPLPLAGNGFSCEICVKRKPSASPHAEGNNYPDNYGDGYNT
jgi:hypothetical protein